MLTKKMLVVEYEKCLSCHSCELACSVAHSESKILLQAIGEKTKSVPRIYVEQIDGKSVPIHCRHCEDAPCIAACPTGAMNRASGDSPVILDKENCNGCNACVVACPYSAITRSGDGIKMTKCDLCIQRQREGLVPACVEACQSRAIQLADENGARAHYEKYPVRRRRVLNTFSVTADTCTKCGVCFKRCPSKAIIWEKKQVAVIVPEKCTKCGICFDVCKFASIIKA